MNTEIYSKNPGVTSLHTHPQSQNYVKKNIPKIDSARLSIQDQKLETQKD